MDQKALNLIYDFWVKNKELTHFHVENKYIEDCHYILQKIPYKEKYCKYLDLNNGNKMIGNDGEDEIIVIKEKDELICFGYTDNVFINPKHLEEYKNVDIDSICDGCTNKPSFRLLKGTSKYSYTHFSCKECLNHEMKWLLSK